MLLWLCFSLRRRIKKRVSSRGQWLVVSAYGNAVPDFDFTNEMSALLSEPSTVTSLRKLPEPTV
jgi:hypothetical protein